MTYSHQINWLEYPGKKPYYSIIFHIYIRKVKKKITPGSHFPKSAESLKRQIDAGIKEKCILFVLHTGILSHTRVFQFLLWTQEQLSMCINI